METRRSLMAKLHIARKDLGLDDDTYRAMLQNLTGKRSSADCTDRQLVMLVAALRKRGWKDSRPKGFLTSGFGCAVPLSGSAVLC